MIRKFICWFAAFFSLPAGVATRDSILNASDRIAGHLDVPEWGGRVHVATLTVSQRAKFLEALGKVGGDGVERALKYYDTQISLIASGVVGADSVPLFTDADVAQLANKSPAIVGRVYDEIIRLNGFSLVATEDQAKN